MCNPENVYTGAYSVSLASLYIVNSLNRANLIYK